MTRQKFKENYYKLVKEYREGKNNLTEIDNLFKSFINIPKSKRILK